MPTRTEVLQGLRSRDETQERDLDLLLDYIDQEAAASDAAARANILRRRNVAYTDRGDLRRIYDYIDLLGAPAGTLRGFTRRFREYDQNSRRFINAILDGMDAGFYVGEYEAAVLADGATSFFKMQDNNPATWTDDGPDAIADMTEDGAGMAQALGLGPFVGSNAFTDTSWGHSSALLDIGMNDSETGSFEIWIKPTLSGILKMLWFGTAGVGPRVVIQTNEAIAVQMFESGALVDPGAWVTATIYAQGDRRRAAVDNSRMVEAEVGGTSAAGEPTWPTDGSTVTDGANVAGFQDGDYGGALAGGTATGLANDGTLYNATVAVDGGAPQAIQVVGSAAQTYTLLIAQLDLDTTGASWALNGGELRCTSDLASDQSSIDTVDGVTESLFGTLTTFVAFNTAVQGLSQITWRDVGARSNWNTVDGPDAPVSAVLTNTWFHVVVVRSATSLELWVDGVMVDEFAYPVADTLPGTFGTPLQWAFASTAFGEATSHQFGAEGASNAYTGLAAYAAFYRAVALTPTQIANHYAIATGIGIQS